MAQFNGNSSAVSIDMMMFKISREFVAVQVLACQWIGMVNIDNKVVVMCLCELFNGAVKQQ